MKTPPLILVIIAVAMVSAIGGLVFNTMPLILSSLANAEGLSARALGNLTLYAGAGYLLGTLTGPFWVDRVNWRFAAFVIVCLASLSFAAGTLVSVALLPLIFFAFAFFCALAIALAMRVLAEMPDPERAFGLRLSVELISIGVFLGVLPVYFISQWGFSGALYGLAGFALVLGLGAFLMPARPTTPVTRAAKRDFFSTFTDAKPAWLMLGIFLIYLIVNVGLFFFLAVIAQGFDPQPAQLGLMFSVLKWLGGAAGLLGAVIGARAGLKLPHGVALLLVLAGVAGLWLAPNFTAFMVASWVWEFGFTLGCLYQTAAIARFDPSNKLVVLVPTAFGISMLLGGRIAGALLSSGSPNGLYSLVIAGSLLPVLFIYLRRDRTAVLSEA